MSPSNDAPLVPVKTWLSGPTFLAYEAKAKALGTTVGVLVGHVATRSLEPPAPRQRKRYTWVTPAMREAIARMHADGMTPTEIGRRLDLHRTSVYRYLPRTDR